MKAAVILNQDGRHVETSPKWKLLRKPILAAAVETTPTAQQLSNTLPAVTDFSHAIEFALVEKLSAIEVGFWGVASDNDSATVKLYGWAEGGPGCHIGTVTPIFGGFTSAATTGFHANANTDQSIREAFAAATAYRGCDTYAETLDNNTSLVMPTTNVDFPGAFIVSFANTQYKYFGAVFTSVTVVGTLTSIGAIYRPLGLKSFLTNPDGS